MISSRTWQTVPRERGPVKRLCGLIRAPRRGQRAPLEHELLLAVALSGAVVLSGTAYASVYDAAKTMDGGGGGGGGGCGGGCGGCS